MAKKGKTRARRIHWRNVILWLLLLCVLVVAIWQGVIWLRSHPQLVHRTVLIVFFVILAVVFGIMLGRFVLRRWRQHQLLKRYAGDSHKVTQLLDGNIWQGQTEQELYDSLGRPHSRQHRVLKTKQKTIMLYHLKDAQVLELTLENGVVVAWSITTT